jgi:hypothetical protein
MFADNYRNYRKKIEEPTPTYGAQEESTPGKLANNYKERQ